MISPDKLFGNLFNDPAITPTRLASFGQDALNKLIAANAPTGGTAPSSQKEAVSKGDFTTIINEVTPSLQALQQQLSGVDISVTQQRGATFTNNQVIAAFQDMMRTQEGVIANAIGGFKSAAYL